MVDERARDVLEVGNGSMGEDQLRVGVSLDEVAQVFGDCRQAPARVDQDRHAPLGGDLEHRVQPGLPEVEGLRAGVELDAGRPGVQAPLGLGDRASVMSSRQNGTRAPSEAAAHAMTRSLGTR